MGGPVPVPQSPAWFQAEGTKEEKGGIHRQPNKRNPSYHQRHSGGIPGELLLSTARVQDVGKTDPLNQSSHWFNIISSKLSIRG